MVANAGKIVSDYRQALAKGDFDAAQKFMASDLFFQGPFDTFHSPAPYLESLKKLGHIVEWIEVRKVFSDGNDACVLYDLVTSTQAGTVLIVEWYHIKGDKIAEIRAVFDPRPFAALFAKGA
jgi:hypothetical protein